MHKASFFRKFLGGAVSMPITRLFIIYLFWIKFWLSLRLRDCSLVHSLSLICYLILPSWVCYSRDSYLLHISSPQLLFLQDFFIAQNWCGQIQIMTLLDHFDNNWHFQMSSTPSAPQRRPSGAPVINLVLCSKWVHKWLMKKNEIALEMVSQWLKCPNYPLF